jgi:hypothetical protein
MQRLHPYFPFGAEHDPEKWNPVFSDKREPVCPEIMLKQTIAMSVCAHPERPWDDK